MLVLDVSLVPVFLINKNHILSASQSATESSVNVTGLSAASFGPFDWSPLAPTKSVLLSAGPNNTLLESSTITFGA